jgi:hypothetical protein
MIPLHLQVLISEASFSIVADNAKSHISEHQCARRRSSAPTTSLPRKNRRRNLKRSRSDPPSVASRWESDCCSSAPEDMGAAPTEDSSLQDILVKPKRRQSIEECPTKPQWQRAARNVLIKPQRRQSIEDPELLAQLHASLSSTEGVIDENRSTAELLALALESLEIFEEEVSAIMATH